MGHTGNSTKENVNNIDVTHLHWGLQLIFDESQKEGNNEIWIDVYPLTRFLAKHTQAAVKVEGTKEWVRTNGIVPPKVDEYKMKPDLSQNEELHQVELKLWMISLMPPECTEYLQKLFGLAYLHLNNEEQIILGTAYLEGGVTNERMQSIINRDSTKIGHMLADLVEKQMLIADKKGRWTSYRLNEIYEIQPEQFEFTDIHHKEVMFQNETDQCIYEYIKTNGFITTQQVVEITKITTTQGANVALGRMMKQNLIRKVRRGKHFIYELR